MRIILSSASCSQEETTSLVGDGHSTTDTIFLKSFFISKILPFLLWMMMVFLSLFFLNTSPLGWRTHVTMAQAQCSEIFLILKVHDHPFVLQGCNLNGVIHVIHYDKQTKTTTKGLKSLSEANKCNMLCQTKKPLRLANIDVFVCVTM